MTQTYRRMIKHVYFISGLCQILLNPPRYDCHLQMNDCHFSNKQKIPNKPLETSQPNGKPLTYRTLNDRHFSYKQKFPNKPLETSEQPNGKPLT